MVRQHKPLILVAEDDAGAARVLARLLRDDGFEVDVTLDGAAAIGRLARSPAPDALVTDLRLPHADGLAVARFARGRCPTLPIVLMTSFPEDPRATSEIGWTPMTKPLVYSALKHELAVQLAQRHNDVSPRRAS